MILLVCPPKFCISIVFVFSWGHCKSREKLETMLMQNLGGQTKGIMVFSEVAYAIRMYFWHVQCKGIIFNKYCLFWWCLGVFYARKTGFKHSKIQERTRSHLASCYLSWFGCQVTKLYKGNTRDGHLNLRAPVIWASKLQNALAWNSSLAQKPT